MKPPCDPPGDPHGPCRACGTWWADYAECASCGELGCISCGGDIGQDWYCKWCLPKVSASEAEVPGETVADSNPVPVEVSQALEGH